MSIGKRKPSPLSSPAGWRGKRRKMKGFKQDPSPYPLPQSGEG